MEYKCDTEGSGIFLWTGSSLLTVNPLDQASLLGRSWDGGGTFMISRSAASQWS